MRRALLVAVALAVALPSLAPAAAEPQPCNPGSWAIHDTPNPSLSQNELQDVFALNEADVWAVGWTYEAHTQPLALHFDGLAWVEVPVPLPPGAMGGMLRQVSGVSPDDVWAVGHSEDADGKPSPFVVHWDGATLQIVPTPGLVGQALTGVTAITPTDAWVVGSGVLEPAETHTGYDQEALTMHWDGSSWSIVPSPKPEGSFAAALSTVSASSPSNVWAIGGWVGPTHAEWGVLISHWDGDSWEIVHDSFQFYGADLVVFSPDNVWVVGYSPQYEPRVRRWNGDSWDAVENSAKGQLHAVDGSSPQDIWMLGSNENVGPEEGTISFGQHWDGEELSVFPTERTTDYFVQFEGMSVAPSGDVFAVGEKISNGNPFRTYVQHLCPITIDEEGSAAMAEGARGTEAAVVTKVEMGDGVAWKFDRANREKHRVRDRSGMDLFDSGLRRRGASFTWRVRGAGTYAWNDPVGHERGKIRVPLELGREQGAWTTVRWATRKPPPGFVYDVQVKAPRKDGFQYWQRGVTSVKATFEWKRGGEFIFRARLRRTTNESFSGWSPLASFEQS